MCPIEVFFVAECVLLLLDESKQDKLKRQGQVIRFIYFTRKEGKEQEEDNYRVLKIESDHKRASLEKTIP